MRLVELKTGGWRGKKAANLEYVNTFAYCTVCVAVSEATFAPARYLFTYGDLYNTMRIACPRTIKVRGNHRLI